MQTAAPPTAQTHVIDRRPTADTAAVTRNPQPQVPMPIPPGQSQQAVVNSTMMNTEPAAKTRETIPIERVLKPYNVAMLPDPAGRRDTAGAQPDGDTT